MEKEELEKLYNELGESKIDQLYYYSCLLCSGFDKDLSYKLIGTLKDLWFKDENNFSISRISDLLYGAYDEVEDEIDDLSTSELLMKIYNYETYGDTIIEDDEWGLYD